MWEVVLLDEVSEWLTSADESTQEQVAAALDMLEAEGPSLGRPLVDRIKGSSLHHLKELRPGSSGRSEVRMLFAFDPRRQALVLVAGDKAGNWKQWYKENIPIAEQRYETHMKLGK
ncbi:hypothetical protein GCM10022197_41850 [Microlunatus spumicola]|uniref:Phage derived protein Gp49-like n=1 Tax=Microlunatus spumicola TaxID=81499 RepID=A0ABP6YFI9_9ACTN